MKTFNLSNTQKRTINTEIQHPGSDTYRLTYLMRFPYHDYPYIIEALNMLISGNLLLRLNKDSNGNVTQYYHEKTSNEYVEIIDMMESDSSQIMDYIQKFTEKPFKTIYNVDLFSFKILKKRDEIIILAKIHHSIFDGTSKTLFYHQIIDAINQQKNGLKIKPNPSNYEEYVNIEKEYLKSPEAEKDRCYWLESLKGYENEYLKLNDLHYTSYDFPLNTDLTSKLKNLSTINGVKISPFVLSLAVSALYYNRCNNTKSTVWNTTYHGRNFGDEVDNMLGLFINMLPMKIEYNPSLTFKEYLLYVKNVLKASLMHGRLSDYAYKNDLLREGVDFDCLMNYSIVSNASNANILNLFADYESNYPLHLRVNRFLDDEKGLQLLSIEANNECFCARQIMEMGDNLIKLLLEIGEDSDKLLKEYDIGKSSYFESKKYYNNLLEGFSKPTIINSDLTNLDDEKFSYKSLILDSKDINDFLSVNNLEANSLFLGVTFYSLSLFTSNSSVLINNISSKNLTNFYKKHWMLPIGLKINNEENIKDYLNIVETLLNKQFLHSNYPINNIECSNNQRLLESNFLYTYTEEKILTKQNKPFNLTVKKENEKYIINLKYYNKSFNNDTIDKFLNKIQETIIKIISENYTQLKELNTYNYNENTHIKISGK